MPTPPDDTRTGDDDCLMTPVQTAKVINFPLSALAQQRFGVSHDQTSASSPKWKRSKAPCAEMSRNERTRRINENLEAARRRTDELIQFCHKWSMTLSQLRQLAEFMEDNPFINSDLMSSLKTP